MVVVGTGPPQRHHWRNSAEPMQTALTDIHHRRSTRALAGLLGASLLFFSAAPVAAQDFTDIFVFGDSLSDTGNGCPVLAIVGYEPGGCSNGLVWVEYFADELGLEVEPSITGGNNYAFGGHWTTDLDDQIWLFSLFGFRPADPDALYVIWLGGNNVLDIPSSPTAMQDAVDDIIDGIRDLQDLGAQHFLIPNLPDMGRAYGDFTLPAGSGSVFTPAERDAVTALSLDFNDRLATALAAEPITTLYELDVEAIVEEIFADPALFGFSPAAIDDFSDDTDFGMPCLVDPVCVFDPQGAVADGFFLFDAIHPTTVGHALIADRAAILVPEPHAVLQIAVGAIGLAVLERRRKRRGSP
jgi:outer membrane lipase/esterase